MKKCKTKELWASATRSAGDLAGVFEFDGDTGYFYLYKVSGEQGRKALAAIHIMDRTPGFGQKDFAIRWNFSENFVGLFIHSNLWAAFDDVGIKYGGHYSRDASPRILPEILQAFKSG
jgi:hypothetical protein